MPTLGNERITVPPPPAADDIFDQRSVAGPAGSSRRGAIPHRRALLVVAQEVGGADPRP